MEVTISSVYHCVVSDIRDLRGREGGREGGREDEDEDADEEIYSHDSYLVKTGWPSVRKSSSWTCNTNQDIQKGIASRLRDKYNTRCIVIDLGRGNIFKF